MFKRLAFVLLTVALASSLGQAKSYLFYLEAQAVGGYSAALKKVIFFSLSQEDVMQKPSLGFDYILRLQGKTGDTGVLALQVRLAWNEEGAAKIEPQIYNAFLKLKTGLADFWIGHSRPSLGLSFALDSHALLLPTLAMSGFGYDRDWGIGFSRDTAWGNMSASLTAGSGMPLYFKGNYLAAGRISRGVLNQDNYNLGLSLAYGRALETMGYHLTRSGPEDVRYLSADLTYLWTNLENRIEVLAGKKEGQNAVALFWRLGINFLEEGRLKLEFQPVYKKIGAASEHILGAGLSYQLNGDLTLRSMFQYSREANDRKIVFQIYYYKGL
jgi:hypothetical protein